VFEVPNRASVKISVPGIAREQFGRQVHMLQTDPLPGRLD